MFIAKVDGTNTLLYLLIEWDADFVDDWFKFVAGFWEVDKVCRVFIKTYGGWGVVGDVLVIRILDDCGDFSCDVFLLGCYR